ncbi:MAG: hypothetical protein JKY37_25400 [Nannocystaceae bacterium]|nr:hypothetical protein [Nannocystaceae bacterium]
MPSPKFRVGGETFTLHRTREILTIRDPSRARLVAQTLWDQLGRSGVESLLGDLGLPPRGDVGAPELLGIVEQRLRSGDLLLVEQDRDLRVLDAPKSTPLAALLVDEPGNRPRTPASTPQQGDTYLDLTFVSEAGTPLHGVGMTIRLPNAETRTESTSDQGVVLLEGLARSGDCTITLSATVQLPSVHEEPPVDVLAPGFMIQRSRREPLTLATGQPHTIVVARPRVRVLELADGYFGEDRKLLLFGLEDAAAPGEFDERVTARGVLRTVLQIAGDAEVLVVGHTDSLGGDDDNQVLSEQRACSVDLYLRGDREGWAAHSHAFQKEADVRAVLNWVAIVEGVACIPGEDVRPALTHFRELFVNQPTDLGADATSMTVADWAAVFDLYDRDLARLLHVSRQRLAELRAKLAFVDHAPLGCGERHPVDAVGKNGFGSDHNRRVDILLFGSDELPDFDADPLDADIYGGAFVPTAILVPGESWARIEVVGGAGEPASFATVRIKTPTGELNATVGDDGATVIACLVGDAIEVLDARSESGDQLLLSAQASRQDDPNARA